MDDSNSNLVDVPPKKSQPPVGKKTGGRPRNQILDELLIESYDRTKGVHDKHFWRCTGSVGERCNVYWSNRPSGRVLKHAMACTRLDPELKKRAIQAAAKKAPSRRLKDAEEAELHALDMKKPKLDDAKEGDPAKHVFFQKAEVMGKQIRAAKLDLLIVKLFAVAGLPTHLASRPVWRDFIGVLDPKFKNPTRDMLENEMIPSEAAECLERQLAYLCTQLNLTVSGDGGTTTGKEAFWTCHISTDGIDGERKVYMTECAEATGESHTAEWIGNFFLRVTF
jgi:hypothetical protein